MKAVPVDLEGFRNVPFVWLPFIDFAGDIPARWQAMNGVLDKILRNYRHPKILDIASGGGSRYHLSLTARLRRHC